MYALFWTPEGYTFSLEGAEQWKSDKAVSACPFWASFCHDRPPLVVR
jgi:hypothetical protein